MAGELDFFKQFLYEAPGDDPPPDMPNDPDVGEAPPDLPDDNSGGSMDNGPPDLDSGGDDGPPPDLNDGFGDDFGDDTGAEEGQDGSNETDIMNLPEKISAIMNMNLYQRYLAMLNNISSQLAQIKDNSDMLYTISPKTIEELVPQLKKLEENIQLYLKNTFINEDYSKNLLFFNKCLNLLALLNEFFDKEVHKGVKNVDK